MFRINKPPTIRHTRTKFVLPQKEWTRRTSPTVLAGEESFRSQRAPARLVCDTPRGKSLSPEASIVNGRTGGNGLQREVRRPTEKRPDVRTSQNGRDSATASDITVDSEQAAEERRRKQIRFIFALLFVFQRRNIILFFEAAAFFAGRITAQPLDSGVRPTVRFPPLRFPSKRFSGSFSKMPDLCPTRKNARFNSLLCISLLIFAAALAFRLLKLALDPGLGRDSTLYLAWADSWFDTGKYLFYELDGPTRTPPLWPWAIKTAMAFGFNADIIGRTISQFLGSLIPVIGFFFALKISRNIRIALLSAFVLIVHPQLVEFAVQPQRDNIYLLFNAILLMVATDAMVNDSTLEWGLCGILLSLAVFCRHEAFEFALLVPFVLLLLFFFKRIKLKQVFVRSTVFFTFFVMTFLLLLSFVDFDYKFFFSPWKIVAWINRALHALHV